jgi:quercetin dioxygenase-like cupin family protein
LKGETVTDQNRRTFLGIAAASLLPIRSDAQTAPPRPPTELARHALTGPFEGWEAVLVELNLPPGAQSSGPGHRHPGPVLGYVAEGRLRFAINKEPEKVVPMGGTFFEPFDAVHSTNGSARSDGPTRALVFMLVPKGKPLTAPA